MGTGTRRVLGPAALFVTSSVMLLLGAPAAMAAGDGPVTQTPASTKTSGQVITVSVWGNGSKAGSAGSGSGGGGRVDVSVPAPCWMTAGFSGKEYFEWVDSGQMARDAYHANESVTPYAGYEQYKDDAQGHWYGAMCTSANWPNQDDIAGFNSFVLEFFATHPSVYVPANETPPRPPVPPALLRDIALNNLRLPDPRLDWNPKLRGNQGTLVNLDTWFWLDSAPTTLRVHAAAGGNEASVIATFGGMKITAPSEKPLNCDGPGTPYTAGAQTNCALAFGRASTALGAEATPVTVTTKWTGTWAANGANQGPLPRQPDPVTATADIRVDEVQTLVTSSQ